MHHALRCSGRACARRKLIYSNVHELCGGTRGLYRLDGGAGGGGVRVRVGSSITSMTGEG